MIDLVLESLNSWIVNKQIGSSIETDDVIAAIKTKKKKNIANIFPKGIIEKTKGRVSKISVGPEVGSIPNVKTPGKIAKPANRATVRSASPIVSAIPEREAFCLM